MLKLGRAQGVAIAAASSKNLSVNEYAPRKIKMAITGNGSASKEQVAGMLQKILSIKDMPQFMDATDALGVAVCHHYEMSSPLASLSGGAKSWKEFISKNPNRIK
jgi:crossover junction endodeoxyribonuclease RuvC